MAKRIIKYITYFILTIFIVIVMFLLFTQTQWFKDIVRNQTVKIANKQLNAYVSLEEVKGNFYSYLELDNFEIREKEDSSLIISLNKISLSYRPWEIWHKKIQVNAIKVNNLNTWLSQDTSGVWNIMEILPETEEDTTTTESQPFAFYLNIDTISIQNTNVYTESNIETLPDSITDFNFFASCAYAQDYLKADLKQFELKTHSPDLILEKINTSVEQNKNQIKLQDLIIQTSRTKLTGYADYNSPGNNKVELEIKPLSREDIAAFIPTVKLAHSPNITMQCLSENGKTNITIDVLIPNENISLKAQLSNLEEFTKDSTTNIPYNANLTINNIKPESWWQMDSTYSVINGQMDVVGSNLVDVKTWQSVVVDLSNSSYQAHNIDRFILDARQEGNTINSKLSAVSSVGQITGNIDLVNPYETPRYNMNLVIDSLLLSNLVSEQAGYTDVFIKVNGENFNPDSIKLNSQVLMHSDNLFGIPIDTAIFVARVNKNLIDLDSANVRLSGAQFLLKAHLNLDDKAINAHAHFNIDSLNFLKTFEIPPLTFENAGGRIEANGFLDSLNAIGNFNITKFRGFNLTTEQMSTTFNVDILKDKIDAQTLLSVQQLETESIKFDSINAAINYNDKSVEAMLSVQMDSLYSQLEAKANIGDTISINFPQFDIRTPFAQYYIPDDNNNIKLHPKNMEVHNLTIRNRMSPDFLIKMEGNLSTEQNSNFELKIDSFNVDVFNHLDLPEEVKGLFNLELLLSGSSEAPEIDSKLNFISGQYGEIEIPNIEGTLTLKDNFLRSELYSPEFKDKLNFSFATAVEARIDTSGFVLNTKNTFEAEINIDSLDLATPIEKYTTASFDGKVHADIKARGTYKDPLLYGVFSLQNGQLSYPDYGVEIDQADIAIRFDSTTVAVDTFRLTRDKGYMTLNGEAVFDSSLVSGKIQNSSLKMDAKEFFLVKHHNYTAQINANTFYENKNNNAEFGGKIEILRSNVYLPALSGGSDEKPIDEKPLLVEAIEPIDTIKVKLANDSIQNEIQASSRFIKNLKGRLQIEIPRNTWVQSEQLKMEIYGDLEIEKSSTFFELYGTLGINRGQYILYGKKFVIEEGQLTFQGGEEFDPVISLKATNTFRDSDKTKRELTLVVSDKLSEPTIAFTLDNEEIPEADGISILLFGKTSDEISFAGQNSVSSAMANEVVAKALTSQLNKTVGKALNLDMIEISATDNWQSAAFVVGKYVTNDLFVIYQKGFGESDGDEITPEMVILEYELNKYLFFRLQSGSSKESGFDVILKLESKKD